MPDEREEEETNLDDSRRCRDDQPSSGSSSTFAQPYAGGMETSTFQHENRPSSWESSPYYQGGSSRQLPLLSTPLPPAPGLVFAPPPPTQQPSSHHDFLLDMMHRSSNFYPQPTSSSPQFAVPPQLPPPPPPPPPPLPRREVVDPLLDYRRFHSVGSQPLTSPLEGPSGSERSLRGSSSYPHLGGSNVFDSINLQSPYPYSPTHPQLSSGSSSASSSYFPSQGGSGSSYSPYPTYSSSHGHLPPSNVLHPLPHPLQYQQQHHHPSPRNSIATPTLWSSSFARDGPLPLPPSPPGSRESAEGHPSSFPRPEALARRGNSSPSIWQSMEPEAGPSTGSAGPPSSVARARSSSTVERAGSTSGGGRKKLPPAATKTLLAWFDNARDKYPSKEQKSEWERTTGLTLQQIDDWFINKRRRVKNVALSQSQGRDEGRR